MAVIVTRSGRVRCAGTTGSSIAPALVIPAKAGIQPLPSPETG
jgi:hypothetical protein